MTLTECLRGGRQCDEDGVEIIMSREACHDAADLIERQAAQIERLHRALCEIAGSKSLTATPTQFYQHLQRVASDATITPPDNQAIEQFAAKVREQCAKMVDQYDYARFSEECSAAIRAIKELP